MAILVLGATGATGRLVVKDLLNHDQNVITLVRKSSLVPHKNLKQIYGTALSLDDQSLLNLLQEVDCVISCLGHNLSFKGIYGAPRMLVRDSIKRICELELQIQAKTKRKAPLKFILMNSTGNRNLDLQEPVSLLHWGLLALIRVLVPPHLDNERAANYLRVKMGNQDPINWVVVRPDTLVDQDNTSPYNLHLSPTRSALLDPGKTSRINVANFIARLTREQDLFASWRGQMPVIYNEVVQENESKLEVN